MLRAGIQQGLKRVFHTSQGAFETRRSRLARATKKENTEKRGERARIAQRTQPDPILGHATGNEGKWENSELAKVLVSEEELQCATGPFDTRTVPVQLPEQYQWGIGGDAKAQHLLFDSLPKVSAQHELKQTDVVHLVDRTDGQKEYDGAMRELHNVHMMTRLVDLRNASASGIAFENRRRCVEAFSAPGKPNDTGRPEVQAALLTMKIRKLWTHLERNRKDIANRRSIRMLVHQRAKMLKYLKRMDRDRYETVLDRLGIEAGAVEGELVV